MANISTSLSQHSSDTTEHYQHLDFQVYEHAAGKARWYFKTLEQLVSNNTTLTILAKDFSDWAREQKSEGSFADTPIENWSMLQKIQADRDMSAYYRKTVQYLFIRDLGKDLNNKQTNEYIEETVASLVKHSRKSPDKDESLVETSLHSWAQKHGIETTYHWLLLKLSEMRELFHAHDAESEGMRKLVKIIAGVVMHQLVENPKTDSATLDATIRLGYCYGLTYPFIDDLLDCSPDLNENDKQLFSQALRQSLQTGTVAPLPKLSKTSATIKRIYHELKWAFEYIRDHLSSAQSQQFFKRAYVFFEAQAIDRDRRLSDQQSLDLEALFLPVMLKSAGCRLIARDLISSDINTEFEYRTFCFGIYNQFNDDIKDIFDDLAEDNITPYTSYLNTPEQHDVSPYQYYWAVVYYLVHEVYQNDAQTKALFMERCINAHRSLKQKVGEQQYFELRKKLLFTNDRAFDKLIDSLVERPAPSAWFDKLVSQEVGAMFKTKREQQHYFTTTYESLVAKVENHLHVKPLNRYSAGVLADVSNYALTSGGKRLRSVLAYYLGQQLYGFSDEQCHDMSTMLEYMHTASLIIDDLPSQDNADTRRGKPTVHVQYKSQATAELGAVYLMMRAVEVQAKITSHPAQAVLTSLTYAANTTQLICEGQLEDLQPANKALTIEQLETTYWLKTGLALEAALVIPALLAEQDEIHISHLKRLAKHIGMAFQIKDDLLDITGDAEQLGKPLDQDADKLTVIEFLGEEQATNRMFEHYYESLTIINDHMPELKAFMGPLLNFIIYRHH